MELYELLITLSNYVMPAIIGFIAAFAIVIIYNIMCLSIAGTTYKDACAASIRPNVGMLPLFLMFASFSIIITSILFLKFAGGVAFISSLFFALPLLVLTVIDFKTQILPDVITKPLIILGLLQAVFGIHTDIIQSALGAFAGYWILWLVNFTFRRLRGIDGMGYGDFKLLSAIGAWGGIQIIPITIIMSSTLGVFVALIIIKMSRSQFDAPTPFGPSLAFTGFIAFLYGNDIINWYISLLSV